MLTHPTLDQLQQLGLKGMARAFAELDANPSASGLSHAEWLALLLDREANDRHDRRLRSRLRYARLRHQAAVEDVDYRAARGLDRALFQTLAGGRWIDEAQNLIIEGPTGVGKSWLACALGHRLIHNAHRLQLRGEFPAQESAAGCSGLTFTPSPGRHRPVQRATRHPADIIGTAGRLQSEPVADITSERPADIIGIRTRASQEPRRDVERGAGADRGLILGEDVGIVMAESESSVRKALSGSSLEAAPR